MNNEKNETREQSVKTNEKPENGEKQPSLASFKTGIRAGLAACQNNSKAAAR